MSSVSSRHDLLSKALQMLLRPLVRFTLRHSLKAQEFEHIARQLFVEEGRHILVQHQQEATISKLAALTGIHRREVTALFRAPTPEAPQTSNVRKILALWESQSRYRDNKDKPRPLICEGADSELADLVRSVSQDLNPYTMLFELERAGMVKRIGNQVKLMRDVYIPRGDADKGFSLGAADINDLLLSVEENVLNDPPVANLHVKTHYDNIAQESIPAIKRWFLEKGAALHREAREFLGKHDIDLNPRLSKSSAGARVALGTFSVTSLGDAYTARLDADKIAPAPSKVTTGSSSKRSTARKKPK